MNSTIFLSVNSLLVVNSAYDLLLYLNDRYDLAAEVIITWRCDVVQMMFKVTQGCSEGKQVDLTADL